MVGAEFGLAAVEGAGHAVQEGDEAVEPVVRGQFLFALKGQAKPGAGEVGSARGVCG